MSLNEEALVQLVASAMASGAVLVVEDRFAFMTKLFAAGENASMGEVMTPLARDFVKIRSDLIEDLEKS